MVLFSAFLAIIIDFFCKNTSRVRQSVAEVWKNEILISFPFHFINKSLVNNGIGITCLECYAWSQKGLRVIDKLGITEHTYIVGLFEIEHQLVDIVGSWNGTT